MPPRVFLVRHGRPAVDPGAAPHTWQLHPAGLADIETLRDSGRLPADARWFSSPEPKALDTARGLTRSDITVVHDLREHEREVTHWFDHADEFADTVRRAFDRPDERAVPEWEPLASTRDRLLPAVRRILTDHPDEEVVLVGHGTAWTLLVAELTRARPDLEAWAALRMPDLWEVGQPVGGQIDGWGWRDAAGTGPGWETGLS